MMTRVTKLALALLVPAAAVIIAGCAGGGGSSQAGPIPGIYGTGGMNTVEVSGIAVSVRHGEPVEGATISIGEQTAATDAGGAFVVEGVEIGRRLLSVDAEDYSLLGGSIEIEVAAQSTDLGQIVLCPGTQLTPPPAPVLP
ncbi:MAG: hypothetical protein U9Q74_14885 [Gemmatimonadota bacterium]|nr:hypothetical protein [Gemmatimonadota bacterium]